MACRGVHSATGRLRSDRIRPEPLLAALWRNRVSTFIGPGWLPEQLGSLYKAGSEKMTQISITTAGIDTSKLKLDTGGKNVCPAELAQPVIMSFNSSAW
jgi:hypothetical protein